MSMAPIEASVGVDMTVGIEPSDIARALDGNDDRILSFVCQLIAYTRSANLREQLLGRLGVFIDAEGVQYEHKTWDDDEFLPPLDVQETP